MTLTIEIDEQTHKRLETEAHIVGKPISTYVADLVKIPNNLPHPRTGRRELGWAKGMIKMSDDFDAPLDEFKEYM